MEHLSFNNKDEVIAAAIGYGEENELIEAIFGFDALRSCRCKCLKFLFLC
jgi:hypothetical protein